MIFFSDCRTHQLNIRNDLITVSVIHRIEYKFNMKRQVVLHVPMATELRHI